MQDSKLNTTDWNISMPPHNDYVVSGVLLLLFNVVLFFHPTASNREETSAVFSHKRLQTVTLLPRHVSVMLPRLMIRSSKKESAAFRASSRIWQFPPENQNRANGNNGCDRPLEDMWSSAVVVMFPWGLVVSWGGLNQLRGGAMCSVCSSSHSRSRAVPPSWITFFLLLHNQLVSSGALCHWTFKCSTVWAESGTYQLFCTAGESTRSLFCFGLRWIFISYILSIDKKKKIIIAAVCFCYWTVLFFLTTTADN